jgi:hypothetical protein
MPGLSISVGLARTPKPRGGAAVTPTPTPTPTPGLARTLAIGPIAGGFVLGGSISDDGSRIAVNTDVATVSYSGTADDNLQHAITASKVPNYKTVTKPDDLASSGNGTYAVDLFGPNPQIAYFSQKGRLWKTTDGFATVSMLPNFYKPMYQNQGSTRGWNDKLKIDPLDSNTFIIGTNGDGAYVSTDGGATLTKIAGLPDVTAEVSGIKMPVLVAVDKSSATLNGRKRRWALYNAGDGVYISTNGPTGPYAKVAGVPADALNGVWGMQFDKDGNLYLAPFLVEKLYRITPAGAWNLETAFECAAWCILGNGQRIAMGPSGQMRWTDVNSPTVWPNDTVQPHYPLPNNIELVSSKARWLNKQTWQCFPDKMIADPVAPNKFWIMQGLGLAWCIAAQRISDKPAEGRMTFHDFSAGSPGNRELIPLKTMFRHTDGMLIETGWDKGPFFSKAIADQRDPVQTRDLGVEHGWDVGYLPQDPTAIWAYIKWFNNRSGFTFDDGATWTQFADHPDPDVQAGCMQFVSRTRGFWLPSNNQRAVQTSDGGQSWQPLVFTSPEGESTASVYTPGEDTGWSYAYFFNKQNLWASYEEPGVVYAYNYGPDNKPTLRGLWRKEANSQTFERVFKGSPSGPNAHLYYQMAIREVPGRVGDLIITAGYDNIDTEVVRSLDRGVTWNPITTTYQGRTVKLNAVTAIGFGKAKQGATHPAMRFAGRIEDAQGAMVYGVYETLDNFATIQLIENYPIDSIQEIVNIAGDPLNFGRWIYGLDSNGWVESSLA